MLAKGKARKGQTAVQKDRSLLFTFPRGDRLKRPALQARKGIDFQSKKGGNHVRVCAGQKKETPDAVF